MGRELAGLTLQAIYIIYRQTATAMIAIYSHVPARISPGVVAGVGPRAQRRRHGDGGRGVFAFPSVSRTSLAGMQSLMGKKRSGVRP
jgi:hypothetical protein